VPVEEVPCNGEDDDCDGATDEVLHERLCEACETGELGACAAGAIVCFEGALRCARRVTPRAESACNLLDDDCDGVRDEAGEVPPEPGPEEVALAAQCQDLDPLEDRLGTACPDAPDVVGCSPGHACVEAACRAGCEAGASGALVECLGRCGPIDASAGRWRCRGGEAGPSCEAPSSRWVAPPA